MEVDEEFKGIKIEDVIEESNVKVEQYQEMHIKVAEIMKNMNGFPEDLNLDVWNNKPYDERFDYLELKHEDITTLNTTKSLIQNILFDLVKDEHREDAYVETLTYYFGIPEDKVREDLKREEPADEEDDNYRYSLKLIYYKENSLGVPDKND